MRRRLIALLVLFGALPFTTVATMSPPGLAVAPGNEHFLRTWERTDRPVLDGLVSRTWMWGPEANTGLLQEAYAESAGGQREVQYFDKARMEITEPDADPNSLWYVTNGLLVVEMISGQLQTGHEAREQRSPANVPVAGDADDTGGPTYAALAGLLDEPAASVGDTVSGRVDRAGQVSEDPAVVALGVTIGYVDDVTGHAIAAPFWDFMNSSGPIWEDGQATTGPLFENAYFATGRPITEPYGALVKVGGTVQLLVLQCFERRCLTYTPQNARAWQVEAGNVGQHYYAWRYEGSPGTDAPLGDWGDAPAGDFSENVEAYTGVVSHFPTYYQHRDTVIDPNHPRGMWVDQATTFWLGSEPPTLTNDSAQDPNQPGNDAYPLFIYAGPGDNPVSCVLIPITTSENYNPAATSVYVNVFVDQNRDGQWKEGREGATELDAWNAERIVADIEVSDFLVPGDLNVLWFSGIRLEAPEMDHWVRVTVTSEPLGEIIDGPDADGLMHDATQIEAPPATYGEIEDHLLINCEALTPLPAQACAVPMANPLPPPVWKTDFCAVELVKSITPVIDTPRVPARRLFGPAAVVHTFGAGCNEDLTFANLALYGFERIDGQGGFPIIALAPPPPAGVHIVGPPDPAVQAAAPLPAQHAGYNQVLGSPAGISITEIRKGARGPVAGADDYFIHIWTAQYPNPGRDRYDRAWPVVRYIGSSGASMSVIGLDGDLLSQPLVGEPAAGFGTPAPQDFTESGDEGEISKTANVSLIQPGQYITYSISMPANPELEEPADATIVDPIQVEFFDANGDLALEDLNCSIGECFYDDAENNVVWTGTVGPGDVVEMSFTIQVPEDLLPDEYPDQYLNCIQGFDGIEEFFDVCESTLVQLPEDEEPPEITKTADVASIQPGQYITYAIVMPANPELEEISDAMLVDPIAVEFFDSQGGLDLLNLSCNIGECLYDDGENNVVWSGAVEPGQVLQLSFMILVPEDLLSDEYPDAYLNCVQGFDGLEDFFDVCSSTSVVLPES